MPFAPPEPTSRDAQLSAHAVPAKILVAGGFGAGKTTLVATTSEIMPLRSEAAMTTASLSVDDASLVPDKTTTTVAMDFGRMMIAEDLVLYLFGTPGQDRFWFMWDDLARGAVGAVVLVDTRRLADCFQAVDYFEQAGLPFILAVNAFPGQPEVADTDLRQALQLRTDVPIVRIDARDQHQAKQALATLVAHALQRR